MRQRGMIHIYTGEGKGKTTAALGLAMRARGHGLRVAYIYFHKEPERWNYGEHRILKEIGVDIFGFSEKHPHFHKKADLREIRKECLNGLKFIKSIYGKKKYDILILDEVNICVRDGFLQQEELMKLIRGKPRGLELVLTGRGAAKGVIKKADLVSEIKNVKHPYDSGQRRRKGIEY